MSLPFPSYIFKVHFRYHLALEDIFSSTFLFAVSYLSPHTIDFWRAETQISLKYNSNFEDVLNHRDCIKSTWFIHVTQPFQACPVTGTRRGISDMLLDSVIFLQFTKLEVAIAVTKKQECKWKLTHFNLRAWDPLLLF